MTIKNKQQQARMGFTLRAQLNFGHRLHGTVKAKVHIRKKTTLTVFRDTESVISYLGTSMSRRPRADAAITDSIPQLNKGEEEKSNKLQEKTRTSTEQ